jgi:two-component system chemotaxis sensor kinase CheA
MIEDEETMLAFIEESQEHMDGIETDLLTIEEDGENIDEDLVNKVFRAVHSIKGGAGFLGLERVKEVAHAAENLLNLVRNKELVPTPERVSVLLESFDLLNSLINDATNSNEVDVTDQINALQNAADSSMETSAAENAVSNDDANTITIGTPDQPAMFSINKIELAQNLKGGNNLYILEYDMIKDIEQKDKTPLDVINDLIQTGNFLDSKIDTEKVGHLEDDHQDMHIPFYALFATIMDKDILTGFIGLEESCIHPISVDLIKPSDSGTGAADILPPAAEPVNDAPAPAQAETPEPVPPVAKPVPTEKPQKKKGGLPPVKKMIKDSSLRVNVKILDNLMTMAGELVLTRNQLVQAVTSDNQQGIDTVSQRLDLVTSELQEAIMSTRMQPIGNVFHKFKRVVRDLSKSLNKQINLLIEGEEVELDKTIIEAIGDPLTHLVRNSVDHGIEQPETRVMNGKDAEGLLRLSAYHEGGQVIIAIEDDGAGINTAKLKEKALTSGIYDRTQLDAMGEKELAKLIFMPGLSTAEQVTDVSGRGVGMDVVHTNLTELGGVIDIETAPGAGTTITIKLPLTLAIIPSQIITAGRDRFAIPQVNLVELVRIPASQVKERIEKIGSALVMRLRGELLPLVSLTDALKIEKIYIDPKTEEENPDRRTNIEDRRGVISDWDEPITADESTPDQETTDERRKTDDRRQSPASAYNIVVLSAGDFHYGLIVDSLLDSEEIVVKPLGGHLRECKAYAGATIQGDGRIAMILDVVGLSNIMNLSTVAENVKNKLQQQENLGQGSEDSQTLLIVQNTPEEQMAIPLGLVSRIEKIKAADVEITGGRRNIQYRGGSLPLFSVDEVANVGRHEAENANCYVVVFPVGGKEVGILMSEIVDILDTNEKVDDISHRQPGILGSMIIFDKITLLVDLYGVVTTIMPDWAVLAGKNEEGEKDDSHNVLIVEDSKFFMNQITEFINESGYVTFQAEDGVEALQVLEENHIDLILTDIEMPNMDGLELTRRVRADERWQKIPVIAVTSVAGEAAEQRGREAGVDAYLIKLDREQIIGKMQEYLR